MLTLSRNTESKLNLFLRLKLTKNVINNNDHCVIHNISPHSQSDNKRDPSLAEMQNTVKMCQTLTFTRGSCCFLTMNM